MVCIKCKNEIENTPFCQFCGAKQETVKRNAKAFLKSFNNIMIDLKLNKNLTPILHQIVVAIQQIPL